MSTEPNKRENIYQLKNLSEITNKKIYQGFQAYKENRQKNVALADAPTGAQHNTHLKRKLNEKKKRDAPTE